MKIALFEREVERNMDPSSKNYMEAVSQIARFIRMYSSEVQQHIGDIITFEDGTSYIILNVIHHILNNVESPILMLEVVSYSNSHDININGYVKKEFWPVAITLDIVNDSEFERALNYMRW